ncbi:MAG: hypothetical protein RR053_00510 [Evtepia sp.]
MKQREFWKNCLIVALIMSAIYLVGRSQLYDGFQTIRQLDSGSESVKEPIEQQISTLQPLRMAVQNEMGRYGIQYDSDQLDLLFETKLGVILGEALGSARQVNTVTEMQWQQVLEGENALIYYEFFTAASLPELSAWLSGGVPNKQLNGEARHLILTSEAGGRLYYRTKNGYYAHDVPNMGEKVEEIAATYETNGAVFAFENPELYGSLAPYVMISNLPSLPLYQASNPLSDLNDIQQSDLLHTLSFHPQAAAYYQAADGLVVREGGDTLRILNDGTLKFHADEAENSRYPGHSESEIAKGILTAVVAEWCGDARLYRIAAETANDKGETVLSYGYLLHGARVRRADLNDAARFVFRNGRLSEFTIHVRHYASLETSSVILPEVQANAAMKAIGQTGKELSLCYQDDGDGPIAADWMAHDDG